MKAVLLVLATLLCAGVIATGGASAKKGHVKESTKRSLRSQAPKCESNKKKAKCEPKKNEENEAKEAKAKASSSTNPPKWKAPDVDETASYRWYVKYELTNPVPDNEDNQKLLFYKKFVCFIGINPPNGGPKNPTGQETTTMKWKGFVEKYGGFKFRVTNLYANRATKPANLNIVELEEAKNSILHEDCQIYVPCWGVYDKVSMEDRPKLKRKAYATLIQLKRSKKPVYIFGLNAADNSPKHAMVQSVEYDDLKKVTDATWKKLGHFSQHCSVNDLK